MLLVFFSEGDELRCRQRYGVRAEHALGMTIRADNESSIVAAAYRAGHALFTSYDLPTLMPTDRRGCAIPLLDGERPVAVFYIGLCDRHTHDDLESLCTLAETISIPFALARERERDIARSLYDGLTGLLTPRAFRDRLGECMTHERNGDPLALWFVDTDRFKEVNDSFGHAVGDRVLQQMAVLLQQHVVRDRDFVARNGGDEYCAALVGIPKTLAIERAQEFCNAVRAYDFGIPLRITASIGVAAFPFDASSPAALLERADRAMYGSKNAGRDRVSFALDGEDCVAYR